MASLSGHKTYSDIIDADIEYEHNNEMVFFNEDKFFQNVIEHLKEN